MEVDTGYWGACGETQLLWSLGVDTGYWGACGETQLLWSLGVDQGYCEKLHQDQNVQMTGDEDSSPPFVMLGVEIRLDWGEWDYSEEKLGVQSYLP